MVRRRNARGEGRWALFAGGGQTLVLNHGRRVESRHCHVEPHRRVGRRDRFVHQQGMGPAHGLSPVATLKSVSKISAALA